MRFEESSEIGLFRLFQKYSLIRVRAVRSRSVQHRQLSVESHAALQRLPRGHDLCMLGMSVRVKRSPELPPGQRHQHRQDEQESGVGWRHHLQHGLDEEQQGDEGVPVSQLQSLHL